MVARTGMLAIFVRSKRPMSLYLGGFGFLFVALGRRALGPLVGFFYRSVSQAESSLDGLFSVQRPRLAFGA